ncbi:hypothetical protein NP493_574g01074 [Ridgeia piscesae]|uniref:UspA domain-containing protein n=1 Tax=Ridgeia piscesae TaxID=27915 RepID=A0AAD9KUE8_RIDPI|nr:hypothetical protein NP493_574g01074 [Ridgeia piscesae]
MSDSNIPAATASMPQTSVHTIRSFSVQPQPGRIVVVAVDASPHSKVAFDWYISNIHQASDLVVLTHIPEVPDLPLFTFKEGIHMPALEWERALTEQIGKVRHLQNGYEEFMVDKQITFKLAGSARRSIGAGIIEVARLENADMIVLGTRGLSAACSALMGSVSDYISRESNIPVLIVPNNTK